MHRSHHPEKDMAPEHRSENVSRGVFSACRDWLGAHGIYSIPGSGSAWPGGKHSIRFNVGHKPTPIIEDSSRVIHSLSEDREQHPGLA